MVQREGVVCSRTKRADAIDIRLSLLSSPSNVSRLTWCTLAAQYQCQRDSSRAPPGRDQTGDRPPWLSILVWAAEWVVMNVGYTVSYTP